MSTPADAVPPSPPDLAIPRWAAVVVEYRSGPCLVPCLRSLLADVSAGPVEIVVVDNDAQPAHQPESVAARLHDAGLDVDPGVRVVTSGENLGYAGGANLGAAATRAPIVAVMNADLVIEPGTGQAMLERLDTERDLGAVGPVVRNPDGSQYPSARSMPSLIDSIGHAMFGVVRPENPFTRRYRQLDVDPSRARDVEWLSGAAMWLRRSALDSVGGWDDGYFMFMEEVDLCWRLRRLGWRVAYDPGGAVVHEQGVSREHHPFQMIVRHHRSVYRYARKRWRGPKRLLLVPAAMFLTMRATIEVVARIFGARPGQPKVSG
ncbi:MAG: glycosyltransferase family 2 protein [Acidimicrobiia bacterium]